MKTGDKILVLILVLGFAVSSAVVWYQRSNQTGAIAIVESNGEVVHRIDLSEVTEPYTFTVKNGNEENVIQVEPGRIRVIEATCPDKVDVLQGWISDSTRTIVCLPNKLVIHIEGAEANNDQIDGISF